MLTMEQSQELIEKFISLRQNKDSSTAQKLAFQKHEQMCISKFEYLVSSKLNRYKNFSNYEDLYQEGMLGLVKAMKNYDPSKGNFFFWAHKYIDTRIARSANLHTTIRFPLKVAKNMTPHKETELPTLIEEQYNPDKQLELSQIQFLLDHKMNDLSAQQRDIIDMFYGLSGDKAQSISKICQTHHLTRSQCLKIIDQALDTLKQNLDL